MKSDKKFSTLKQEGKFQGKWRIDDNEFETILENRNIEVYYETSCLFLTEKILEWFYNDELGIVIIHGQQGYGKSTYACISAAEVYGHLIDDGIYYYDWDAARNHLVFTPRQFLQKSREQRMQGRMIVWDDAGFYLNALDYYDPLVKAVGKFMEVARSKWASIVFTCSDQKQILSKIRNIPHAYTIKIIKSSTPSRSNPEHIWKKDLRAAKIHKSWISEDLKKSGRKTKEYDSFYAHMPNYFYQWYKPFRDAYCTTALDDIEKTLDKMKL